MGLEGLTGVKWEQRAHVCTHECCTAGELGVPGTRRLSGGLGGRAPVSL